MKPSLLVINVISSFLISLVLHECGHLIAAHLCGVPVSEAGVGWGPRLFGFRLGRVACDLRLLPIGAYVRMNMVELQRRSLNQQLFVLIAGIAVNLVLAAFTLGTVFGSINLALAIGNILPIYQHDGWKSGIVVCRRIFGRPSPLIEWTFTVSGGLLGLFVVARALFTF